jgi:hypothetical protein
MAEVLSDEGYATFCVGKWHLARMEQCSAAGPFDQWPLGRGFDRFYGFLEGETDQFHPDLVCDNHHVEAPSPVRSDRSERTVYHLSEDLVDQALGMIADSVGCGPTGPSSPIWPSARPTPRIRRPRPTWRSTGAATTRAGTSCAGAGSSVNRPGGDPRGNRVGATQPRGRAVGGPAREPASPRRPAAGGVRRLSRSHRRPDRPVLVDALDRLGLTRQHDAVCPRRQRRLPGGRSRSA